MTAPSAREYEAMLVKLGPRFLPPLHAREWWMGTAFVTVASSAVVLGAQLAPSKFAGLITTDQEYGMIDQVCIGADVLAPSAGTLYRFVRWDNFDPLNPPPNIFSISNTEFLSLPSVPLGDAGGVMIGPSVGAANYATAIAPIVSSVTFTTRVFIRSNTLVQLWGRSGSATPTLLYGYFHGWTWSRDTAPDVE